MHVLKSFTLLSLVLAFAAGGSSLAAQKAGEDLSNSDARTALAKAKITLGQAIQAAIQKAPGKALEAKLEVDDGEVSFAVEVVSGKKHQEVTVDATTGEVTDIEEESPDEKEADEESGEDESLETQAANEAKITMLEALRTAQSQIRGAKPYESRFERHDDRLCILVHAWDGQKALDAHIDAMTGKLLDTQSKRE